MNKLDELRRKIAQEQQEGASWHAAQEAAADAALEVAVREDLPKWTELLEAAVKRKVSSHYMEIVYTPESWGGMFFFGRPATRVVKSWPSIDILRIGSNARLHVYASRITSQLGHPFELTFHESSEGDDRFSLTWN